jgi:hypothetical protein
MQRRFKGGIAREKLAAPCALRFLLRSPHQAGVRAARRDTNAHQLRLCIRIRSARRAPRPLKRFQLWRQYRMGEIGACLLHNLPRKTGRQQPCERGTSGCMGAQASRRMSFSSFRGPNRHARKFQTVPSNRHQPRGGIWLKLGLIGWSLRLGTFARWPNVLQCRLTWTPVAAQGSRRARSEHSVPKIWLP